ITDEVWELIRDVFPPARTRGRPPVDRRTVVEATAWRFRTGCAWRDLPDRFGSWNTIYKNFRRWATDGVWEDLLTHVQKRASLAGEIDWVVSVDSSIARVHQHGATLPRGTGGSIELQEVRAGASWPRDRPVTGRVDDEDPSRLRWEGAGAGVRAHRRAGRGHEHVHRRARRDPRPWTGGVRARGRSGCSRTRAIRRRRTGPGCASAASRPRSPNATTRSRSDASGRGVRSTSVTSSRSATRAAT